VFTIHIEDLKVEAIIGILPSERKSSQLIIANCEIVYEKRQDEFVNYAEVVSIIESMLIEQKYGLIEDALEELTATLYKKFNQIKSIKLKLAKPKILDNCIVGVEYLRKI
jgi:dihydroneopterin aldolase